jgi:hypothetical protein
MTRTKLIFLICCALFCYQAKAQTCTIKINDRGDLFEAGFEEEMDLFFQVKFVINGVELNTTDTTAIEIQINKAGFDTLHYQYVDQNDKTVNETALCKFRSGETYTVSPCTCCGIFLITPEDNAKRGFVKFKNNSKKEYIAIASEIRSDTLFKKSETEFVFSSISMNCGFRPNRIFIANFDYFNKKYQYENWKTKSREEKKELEKERESHVAYSFNYLFLHEEKIVLTIGKKKGEFHVDLAQE